jgi:phage terminase large subunit-like protein
MKSYKYHPYIDEYIHLIENGTILACKEQHQLIEYVKTILDRDDVYIDSEKIELAISTQEKYFYKRFPFQKFIDCFVYGVFYSDGSLVFDEFFIMMGRGNGKNGWISPNAWYLTTHYHGVNYYDIDLVATSEEQAMRSFNDIYSMLEMNWTKLKKWHYRSKIQISFNKTQSTIKYRTSNAKTKDGGRPGCVIFDEIHAYEDYENINVFTSGLGKVKNPRLFYITTDGHVRGSVLDDMKKEAKDVLIGANKNIGLFPFICKLDSAEEADNPEMWIKANPAINYMPELKKRIKKDYEKSQGVPQKKLEFYAKRMNIPVQDTMTAVAEWELIEATNQEIPDLSRMDCVGGIDFADIRDFVGCGLLFKKDGKRYWIHHTFINEKSLKLTKFRPGLIEEAIDKGLVTIIKDDVNKPEHILGWFVEMSKKYNIKKIASDIVRINYIKEKFEEAGFKVEIARSGSFTHTKLSPIIEEMFSTRSIVYGNDMMMRWYTNNVYVKLDGKGNKTYEKIEPIKRKTDGFMALIHSLTLDSEIKEQVPLTMENIKKIFKSYSY